MRVAHLVQQHQRLLELGNPALEPLFTEGGPIGQPRRENPSRVTGTSGGSGERDATQPLREGPVEAEANRGTEGPSLSTMWSAAAERSPGGTTRKPNYWFVRRTASQQCRLSLCVSAQNDLDSSSSWVKIFTSPELERSASSRVKSVHR